MNHTLAPILAVVSKDIRSELRTRFGVSSLLLFVVTCVTLVVFSTADEPLAKPLAAGVTWVVMFTTSMTGLGRGFIAEEERGTTLFLRLLAPSYAIYVGKLVVNLILSILTSLLTGLMFAFFVPSVTVGAPLTYMVVVAAGAFGLATVLTIVSAIVAKAGAKNAILPVLAFPILLPLLLPGVNAMLMAMAGFSVSEAWGDIGLMLAYTGIVAVLSWLVFDVLWYD